MTLPPSVLPRSQTGFRKTRRRAPVSDRPVVGLLAELSLPTGGELMTIEEIVPVYVGLDWAAETHAICVLDHAGRQLAAFTVEHTADGITSLIHRLSKYGDPADVQVWP